MKKIIFVFLLIISFVKFNANEIENDVTNYYEVSTNLNVRTGACKKYPVSFTLKKGDKVDFIAKHKEWSEIKYFDKTGLVSSKYLIERKSILDKNNQLKIGVFSNFINIVVGLIFLVIAFKIYKKIRVIIKKRQDKALLETVTDLHRGTWSEQDLVLRFLKCNVPSQNIFHDLYVRNIYRSFAQIDLVVITQIGIIVFEVKDYKGWIYGNAKVSTMDSDIFQQ